MQHPALLIAIALVATSCRSKDKAAPEPSPAEPAETAPASPAAPTPVPTRDAGTPDAKKPGVAPMNIVTLDEYNARQAKPVPPPAGEDDSGDEIEFVKATPRVVPAAISIRWVTEDGAQWWRTDGFPAVSKDGHIALLGQANGGTGWPHLAVEIYRVGKKGLVRTETTTILADRDMGGGPDGLTLKIPKAEFRARADKLLASLKTRGFRPAIPLVEELELADDVDAGRIRVFDFHLVVQPTMFQVIRRDTGWIAAQYNPTSNAHHPLPDTEPCIYTFEHKPNRFSAYLAPNHHSVIAIPTFEAGPDYCDPEGRTTVLALTRAKSR